MKMKLHQPQRKAMRIRIVLVILGHPALAKSQCPRSERKTARHPIPDVEKRIRPGSHHAEAKRCILNRWRRRRGLERAIAIILPDTVQIRMIAGGPWHRPREIRLPIRRPGNLRRREIWPLRSRIAEG